MMVDIEKLRALLAAATPGPWKASIYYDDGQPSGVDVESESGSVCDVRGRQLATEDAAFIAASRDALPALLAEVERLRAENAQLRARKAEMCSCVRRYETPGCDECDGVGAVIVEGP